MSTQVSLVNDGYDAYLQIDSGDVTMTISLGDIDNLIEELKMKKQELIDCKALSK